ncbi:MAG: hypothetical protein AAF583_17470, partial [Pseudomonadota bacterium]
HQGGAQGEAVGMTPKDDLRSQSPAPLRGDRALADAPSAHLTDGIDIEAEGDDQRPRHLQTSRVRLSGQ